MRDTMRNIDKLFQTRQIAWKRSERSNACTVGDKSILPKRKIRKKFFTKFDRLSHPIKIKNFPSYSTPNFHPQIFVKKRPNENLVLLPLPVRHTIIYLLNKYF